MWKDMSLCATHLYSEIVLQKAVALQRTQGMSSPPQPSQAPLFFAIAVAYTVCWTAISSELGRLSIVFGPQVLLQCNLAYFLPSLPILVLQLLCDEHYDKKFGRFRSNSWRAVAGFGGCSALATSYPFHPETLGWLLTVVALLGICSSIAFGSSYQLAARQPPQDTVALSLGYVSSGPLVLAVEAALRMGPRCGRLQVLLLYQFVALLCAGGLAAALLVQLRAWRLAGPALGGAAAAGGGDGSGPLEPLLADAECEEGQGGSLVWRGHSAANGNGLLHAAAPPASGWEDQEPPGSSEDTLEPCEVLDDPAASGPDALPGAPLGVASGYSSGSGSGTGQGVYGEVLRRVWRVAAALAVSISTSMLLFPFFTYVPSSGWLGMMLPQVLFWTRVFADIAGRLLPRLYAVTSPATLLLLAAVKLALTPLLFLYIQGRVPLLPPGATSDGAALAFVAAQWLLSGFVNSCCYMAAPRLVPSRLGPKAAAVMTLVFQGGCLAGLLAAVPARRWGVPS